MSGHPSPPKRPRLSLQTKAISTGPSVRTSRTLAAVVNPRSPTAFNTLTNVYSTAIDRSTPIQEEPMTAINTKGQPLLKIQTQGPGKEQQNHTPFLSAYPDTPLTAQPVSPSRPSELTLPSSMAMTATPPLSAGPTEAGGGQRAFCFSPSEVVSQRMWANNFPPPSPYGDRRQTTAPSHGSLARPPPPYARTKSLHSILRNSPLPPKSAQSPISPRRQSLRLKEKAARRVGYDNPLTQTITTNHYTKSHIDLLYEEASPYSPADPFSDPEIALDLTMAYTDDETRDGGQTPGPFEEMRRRVAGLGTLSPGGTSPGGIRKRKRREEKRRWVWTIGQDEDDESLGKSGMVVGTTMEAQSINKPSVSVPILVTPVARPRKGPSQLSINVVEADSAPPVEILTPSIEADQSQDSLVSETGVDVDMSDAASEATESTGRSLNSGEVDVDMITPTVLCNGEHEAEMQRRLGTSRLASEDMIDPKTGLRRDTPIPADLIA